MSYSNIEQLMATKCCHFSHNYYHHKENPICTSMCEKINHIIALNCEIPTQEFVSYFISYIYTGHKSGYSSYYKNCISSESKGMIIETLRNLLFLQNPTSSGLIILVKNKMNEMIELVSEKNLKLPFSEYSSVIKASNDSVITKYLTNFLKEEDFDKAMELYITYPSYLNMIDKLLGTEYIPTQDIFEKLHKLIPKSDKYILHFESFGLFYNETCLENACFSGYAATIKKLLDLRISPTKKCFENIVSHQIYERGNLIDMLVYYNYIITYDDVVFAIKHTFEIKDLDRFNIVLDTDALELCYAYNFHPKNYNFEGVDASMRTLQNSATKGNNVTEIKKLIKNYNLVPDKITMENACNFSRNRSAITELINGGGILTPKCIQNCGSHLSNNDTLMYITSEFIKQSKEQDDKIVALEKELKELKEKQNETIKINNEYAKVELDDDSINMDNDIDNIDNINPITNKTDTNTTKNKSTAIISTSNQSTQDDVIKILKINIPTSVKVPNNKRNKMNPPNVLVKFFALDKSKKLSYIEARKYLRDIIKDKKWISEENKTLINFPKDFRTILGIELDGFIHHSDLDKIVSLCYK